MVTVMVTVMVMVDTGLVVSLHFNMYWIEFSFIQHNEHNTYSVSNKVGSNIDNKDTRCTLLYS